jgi:hypothetical protein
MDRVSKLHRRNNPITKGTVPFGYYKRYYYECNYEAAMDISNHLRPEHGILGVFFPHSAR